MDRNAIAQVVYRSVRSNLLAAPVELSEEMSANDIDGWDSLAHTNIVIDVERELRIRLPTANLYKVRNIGQLIDLVESILV